MARYEGEQFWALGGERVYIGDISSFCGGCDYFGGKKKACKEPRTDRMQQVEYVKRGNCVWAEVSGEVGRMTNDGFKKSSDHL